MPDPIVYLPLRECTNRVDMERIVAEILRWHEHANVPSPSDDDCEKAMAYRRVGSCLEEDSEIELTIQFPSGNRYTLMMEREGDLDDGAWRTVTYYNIIMAEILKRET